MLEAQEAPDLLCRTLEALASALGVPVAWLGYGEGATPDPERIRRHVAARTRALARSESGDGAA